MSEYATRTARRNLVHNPRPASLSRFSVAGGATMALATERSYSGIYSVRASLPTFGLVTWQAAVNDDADLAAIPSGSTIYAAISASGDNLSGLTLIFRVTYTDATTTQDSQVLTTPPALSFHRFLSAPISLTPGKTVRQIEAIVGGGPGGTKIIFIGGFDVSVSQEVDGFVHGDAGAGYSWEGTANDSPSNRTAATIQPVLGHGGQIAPSVRVEVVNQQGQRIRDITSHFRSGSVTYDLDAEDWKGTCQLVLDNPNLVVPYLATELAKIWLRVEYPNGTAVDDSLGMFILDPPRERWSQFEDEWTYEGRDMLSLISTHTVRGLPISDFGLATSFQAPELSAGFGYDTRRTLHEMVRILMGTIAGFAEWQYPFVVQLPGYLPHSMAWENGTSVLRILTDLLEAAGWRRPWVSVHGVISSAPAGTNPSAIAPAVVFATGENSKVRWPFEVEPQLGNVSNRVRVVASGLVPMVDGYHRTPLDVIVANMDVSHPLSFPRLGRWLDAEDFVMPVYTDQAAVEANARQRLYEAGRLPIRVRLVTEAHPRGLDEVYELNLVDPFGNPIDSGQGRYFCRGWTIQLGPPWEMTHTLTRVIDWTGTAYF